MVIWKVCLTLGWAVTADPTKRADLVFRWDKSTFAEDDEVLERVTVARPVVNRACVDISKNHVNEVFEEAFGYNLGVNPLTHVGECVEKSDLNAVHDGRIINCPIEHADAGSSYQRVVDNVGDDGRIVDFRVPIIAGTIPFVYLRYRPVARRFHSGNEHVELANLYDMLSQQEVADVLRFCRLLGMDYGELDVLRDRVDKRLYVVDANTTPWGPPSGISRVDGKRAITLLAAAFQSEFLLKGEWSV